MVRTLSLILAVMACLSLEGERRAGADRLFPRSGGAAASRLSLGADEHQLVQELSPSTGLASPRGGVILPASGGGGGASGDVIGPRFDDEHEATQPAQLVVIEAAPAPATNRTTATFRFTAPGVRAPSFRCGVDRGAMSACTSPWTRANLSEGSHTFRVQLVGPGRRALASALHRWAVDLTPPMAAITGGPTGDTDDPTPTFAFSLDSLADVAECRILTSSEMPPMQRCTSPFTAPALRGGAATFELRVRDAAGNDLTLTRSFTVVAPGSVPRIGDEPAPRS